MLLGIAIGDAFGAGYEFLKGGREKVREVFDETKYRQHPSKSFRHRLGCYTDDTQMSIAVAELLLSSKEFIHFNLAYKFVECYKRDPAIGYAQGFQKFLDSVSSGSEFLSGIKPNSNKNGAAMRAVPLGLFKNPDDVFNNAMINAELTHNTLEGLMSSVTIALASHYFVHDLGEPPDLLNFIMPYINCPFSKQLSYFKDVQNMVGLDMRVLVGKNHENKGVPCDAVKTAGAVLYILNNYSDNPWQALKQSVLLGGDTDSVASISLGIIASKYGLDNLPPFLLEDLTNGEYGKDYLKELGGKLHEKFFPTLR